MWHLDVARDADFPHHDHERSQDILSYQGAIQIRETKKEGAELSKGRDESELHLKIIFSMTNVPSAHSIVLCLHVKPQMVVTQLTP